MGELGCLNDASLNCLDVVSPISAPGFITKGNAAQPSNVHLFGRNNIDVHAQDQYQNYPVGTRLHFDEHEYVYCLAGAAIPAASLIQTAAVTEGDIGVQAAHVAGVKTISVTTTATTAADQYNDGMLYVTQNNAQPTRVGGGYKIKSHGSGVGGTTSFVLYDAPKMALDTSSKVTIVAQKYRGVIQAPGTLTGSLLGVAPSVNDADAGLTDEHFFWALTKGVGPVLKTDTSDASLVGMPVVHLAGGTAGHASTIGGEAAADATAVTNAVFNSNPIIGYVFDAPGGADADCALVNFNFH